MLVNILSALWVSVLILWFLGLIWDKHPYKMMTWFFHDVLAWHKPDLHVMFDGCSRHSYCRFCGKEIMEDSEGNWFTFT